VPEAAARHPQLLAERTSVAARASGQSLGALSAIARRPQPGSTLSPPSLRPFLPLPSTPQQATKNLEKAKRVWDGEEAELAQVHNALGFCYFQMARVRARARARLGAGRMARSGGGGSGAGGRAATMRQVPPHPLGPLPGRPPPPPPLGLHAEQYEVAIAEYEKAVQLQAGYVTAWNNLGDAYEATKQWRCARRGHDAPGPLRRR
jgi:tetratricopeptide (TPR) repeat protein